MVALFSRPGTKEVTPQRSMPETSEQAPVLPAPGQAGRVQNRPSAEQSSWSPSGPLQCLWYRAELADTVAVVDEFLRTPAAATALADFCRARRRSHAAPLEAHTLAGAVAHIALRMCP